jgi:anti-sigma-K factor RskA
MAHEDYNAILPLHALSALDQGEEREMKEHLRACEDCRRELDGWRETAGALAYTVKPLEPSAQLRDLIMESVRKQTEPAKVTKVIPLQSRRAPRPFPKLEAIAAILIFLALLLGLIVLWDENRTARGEIARLSAQINDAQNQLDQEHQILKALTQRGVRKAELGGTKDAPAAHATLAFDTKSGSAVLLAEGLPPAPAGKAFQLWFIVGVRALPGKVFKTDSTGNAVLYDRVPAGALDSATFAITLEPQEGVAAPTGPKYLVSKHS